MKVGSLTLHQVLRADLKVDDLDALPERCRESVPLDTRPHPGRPPRGEGASADLPWPEGGWADHVRRLTAGYRDGSRSPKAVVEKVLEEAAALAALTPSVGPLCDVATEQALAEAAASERRWREGKPKGPLDGVPWAVKEQTAVRGLPRRSGTAYADPTPQSDDATAVARMRAAGLIAVGTTVMTELGMTPNGANPKRSMPRNPHATDRIAGGSSTGSGVAVATGLVPIALGVDGGGSIRIPSAINGVFGIKPTWGRISRSGDTSTGSVSHLGPLACGTVELAYALETMSGPDSEDPQTFAAPARSPGSFLAALGRGVRGMVIGVPESEWEFASEPVQRVGRAALAALEKEGATIVPVELELARHAPAIGCVVIAAEARASVRYDWKHHADEMGHDLQITFAVLETFNAVEFLDTMRLRAGLRRELAKTFRSVDLLALPSTTMVGAKVSDTDMRTGFLDTKVIDGLCRFSFLGNLTGLPALSAPVGVDGMGLPVGLQLVGDAWDEATVLAAAAHLERIGVAATRRPRFSVGGARA